MPKGTDFRTLSDQNIARIEYLLNSRPRKRLSWKTPYEVFYELTGVALQDCRVGFLDRKLHIVSKYCDKPKEWLHWAKEAYEASYGYEWQGDNVLIARENLLYTLITIKGQVRRSPSLAVQHEFAEIISWNIFQMDGIKYVVPMSCHHEIRVVPGELTLFGETPDTVEKYECEGCKFNRPTKHNGKYVRIMDWSTSKPLKLITLLGVLSLTKNEPDQFYLLRTGIANYYLDINLLK